MIPIVIPLHPAGGKLRDNSELRFALRSLAMHFKEPFEVVIVGQALPAGFQGLKHLQCGGGLKRALRVAANAYPAGFFWFYDDCCLLRDMSVQAMKITPACKVWRRAQTSWSRRLNQIKDRLEREGHLARDYSRPHGPYWFDKGMIDEAFADWPKMKAKFPFESWILSKRKWQASFGLVKQYYGRFNGAPGEAARYLNYNDKGFTKELRAWLVERFPERSPWEVVPPPRVKVDTVRGVVIGLKRRPRWEECCVEECAKSGIVLDRFDGVDGHFDVPTIRVNGAAFRAGFKRNPLAGEIGCFNSHVEAARKFAELPPLAPGYEDWRLVLEDDAIPRGIDAAKILAHAEEAERRRYDVVFLHAGRANERETRAEGLAKGGKTETGTYAYLIRSRGAADISNWVMRHPIDVAIRKSRKLTLGVLNGNSRFAHRVVNPSVPALTHDRRGESTASVLIVAWAEGLAHFTPGLAAYHRKQGHAVKAVQFKQLELAAEVGKHDIVYLWNGALPTMRAMAAAFRETGARVVFCEAGWFPQRKYFYMDAAGAKGNSSLFLDPLDWLTDQDFARLEAVRRAYRGGRELSSGGYVLVPLQLAHDTQIQFWSPFATMAEFIEHCREVFRGRKVIFRKHPRDGTNYGEATADGGGDLKDLICGADLVYGINSTVLLEAALIGKPVVAVGKSLLSIGPSREHALAALLARQVPVGKADLRRWMGKGSGLDHYELPSISSTGPGGV